MLESYITPMLMGYIDKYVKNIKPSDLQVSFWGGDVVLRNLELRLDVLEHELPYPLEIKSGHIRELILHIPWNAILSKPVEVGLKDVEIVVKLKSIRINSTASRNRAHDSPDSDVVITTQSKYDGTSDPTPQQQQQGYLQGYTNRILNNLNFHVQNLVIKVIEEECDLMMSFNIQSLRFHMTDENWLPSYVCTDYCDGDYTLNKVLAITDMVVHLQTIDSDRAQNHLPLKDPFVKKCSVSCRMELQYRGKKFLKKSTCILFDSLVFCADESQFSLFFHLVDWLLAMYYNGKRLKGRDDKNKKNTIKSVGAGVMEDGSGFMASGAENTSFDDVLLSSGSVGDLERQQQVGGRGIEQGGGWGSWMWSFVAAEEEGEQGEGGKDGGSGQASIAESSSFSIVAKSITVNLKVTHHGRVPVFSAPRSRSRTVLTVLLSGCCVRIDNVPSTQLFAMSIGIMSIQAGACGPCSCADTSPSSWKTNTDSNEKVLVFTLGDINSCNTDLVLTGSLFDPETITVPPDKQSPPLPELLLAPRPEFTALWFTYEYYDVGPQHTIEICDERLMVGEVNILVSPDTLHRVSHFTSAYSESVKACPLFSEGMVVIGDPKADTTFKITLAGGQAIVASNTHYFLSSSSSSSLGEHSKSNKPPSKLTNTAFPPPSSTSPLPTITVSLSRSTVAMTLAMYSGNATQEIPQRHQIIVTLNELVVAEGNDFKLNTSTKNQLNKIVTVPKLEIYKHTKTSGIDNDINGSSYLQLHFEDFSCIISPKQLSSTNYIFSSWYHGPSQTSSSPQSKIECPPTMTSQALGGHLHFSLKEVELTKSVTAAFTFVSATVTSCSVVLLCDSTIGRLCHAIPIVSGPIDTECWNTRDSYNDSRRVHPEYQREGEDSRLLEFFTALPNQNHAAENYPTLQLTVAGIAVCLDTAVLEFIKCIHPLIPTTTITQQPGENVKIESLHPSVPREPGTLRPPSVLSEDTEREGVHTPNVMSDDGVSSKEDIITVLKSYATKVDVKPIVIVIPVKPLDEGLMSTELPEFPVLPVLCGNTSVEALIVCLPHLSLISAKSHVLEEPVPKGTSINTLPWNCTLHQATLIAIHRDSTRADYVVDPLSITVALADQQNGTGVTIHTDTVAITLSKREGQLLNDCASNIMDCVSSIFASPSCEDNEDSGIHSSYNPPLTPGPRSHHPTPSHLSSPAQSTVTTATLTTLPAHASLGTVSTNTSSLLYTHNSFSSSLWIQAIVSKITLTFIAPQPIHPLYTNSKLAPTVSDGEDDGVDSDHSLMMSVQSKTSSTGSFMTPLTSPTGGGDTQMEESGTFHSEENREVIDDVFSGQDFVEVEKKGMQIRAPQKGNGNETANNMRNGNGTGNSMKNGNRAGKSGGSAVDSDTVLVKFSMEIDGVSVQFDVQEKCTDLILKVSAIDANLYRRAAVGPTSLLIGNTNEQQSLRGKSGLWRPYLSSEKILSSKGSALPAELSEILTHSSPTAIHLPPQAHSVTSNSFRNFITLELTTPRQSLHRATSLKLKLQSFEAVVWLPIINVVSSVLSSMTLGKEEEEEEEGKNKRSTTKQEPQDVGWWPAIDVTVECCRFTLPSSDYTNSILCNIGCITMSHSFDYPTNDIRYVVSASAFRRLTHLSNEKKQPPLPAYQMDLLSMSVWGVHRGDDESAQVLLYAGSSDVRLVYTPALYWRPTGAGTSHRPAILACGHCIEVNFRTDLDFILGPEQVECVMTILQTNTLSTTTKLSSTTQHLTTPIATPTKPLTTSIKPSGTQSSVPFKGLVTGTTVGLTLVSSNILAKNVNEIPDSGSESSEYMFATLHGLDSTVTPLLQLQLFNILFSVSTTTGGVLHVEASCFNMSIGYCCDGEAVCSYSDLVDAGMTSSLMESPLLETRRGHSQNTREIPPSVVTVTWDIPPNKHSALTFEISRPLKLTLTNKLIEKLSDFSDSILKSIGDHRGMETAPTAEYESDCMQEPLQEIDTAITGHTESSKCMQVKVKSVQVLVEFQLSSKCVELSDSRNERELMMGSMERDRVQLQATSMPVTVAEEGLLFVWDSLDLAYPNTTVSTHPTSSSITGDIHISGLQLLSIINCNTSTILLPTQLNCFLQQHIPTSHLDIGYVSINLSCGLLEVRLSRQVLDLADRIYHSLTNLITSLSGDSSVNIKEREGVKRDAEVDDVIHFHDDLRAEDFAYIKDSDQVLGYSPQPGEVFFSLGSHDGTASMAWQYREPRAITKLSILPVPFSFTSESDAPIDIEVGCTLDYWDEDRGVFSVLEEFRLSETTPTEVLVSKVTGSRKWRIVIVEIEWEDEEDDEERFVSSNADMVDGEGAPVPIATILSPVLLAGGTCVDSFFSPKLVPVSDLRLTCNEMQITLIYNAPSHPGHYGRYKVVPLTNSAQELARLHVEHLTCHLKQMRDTNTTLQVDGQLSVEFIDFLDLSWRVALYPTHIHTNLHRIACYQQDQLAHHHSSNSTDMCDITVKCSPAVVRVSQGLLHTTSLAVHTWNTRGAAGEMMGVDSIDEAPIILNHLLLCNNTLVEIHFGQVSTNEVTALQSLECIGYSWRNCKRTPQMLHLCIVTDGVWRWTKPFSITSVGSQSVDVYIGTHTALVNVTVINIGGLQKQVIFTGIWTFVSTLPFPIHISLVTSQNSQDTDHAHSDVIPPELYETLILSPESSLPSLIIPASQLSGVKVRSPQSTVWSEVFPIHSTTEDWNKPQLLTEMEYSSGQRVNLWYNIKPMHTSKHDPLGSRITLSPLFAVCNHLPFDVTMVATETNATGPAPLSLPDCPLKGEGERTILCGLRANTWYHLSFKQSGCESVSEPTVSLSTFLLVHLPFSQISDGAEEGREGEEERKRTWPYVDDNTQIGPSRAAVSSSIEVKLPLNNGSYSILHAVMERSPINTITLHLQPDVMVINRSQITLQLLTRNGNKHEKEMSEDGVMMETVSSLSPNHVGIIPQTKFFLATEWKGRTLLSQPVTANSESDPQSTNVILTENESNDQISVFVNLTLVQRFKGAMTIVVIKPTYIFHNNTTLDMNVSMCLFHEGIQQELSRDHKPLVTESVGSQSTVPLLFWEHKDMGGSGEAVQALKLKSTSQDRVWSLPLSSDFVRHSFALPTSRDHYVQAVLTMHEHSDTVYMVASIDPAPRILVLNHTKQNIEIVEEGAQGIHGYPQCIPPKQQVTYEPPTYAKQYPLVFDEEMAQGEGSKAQANMAKVAVKFRQVQEADSDENTETEREGVWSDPFHLSSDSDRIISISHSESVLVSTHRKGTTLYLTLLPTGQTSDSYTLPESLSDTSLEVGWEKRQEMKINLTLAQFVVCLDDEVTEDNKSIEEVLQIISDDAVLKFSSVGWEGNSLDLTLKSLYVNNMTETGAGDYAVTVIPRMEHLRRASLIASEPAPLAMLSVRYSPDSTNLIEELCIAVQPLTLQLEDGLLNRLRSLVGSYRAPGVLLTGPSQSIPSESLLTPPQAVLVEASRDVVPLAVNKLIIHSTAFYLNARISLRVLLSCNDSPFRFSRYQLENIYSNWTEVSQTIASRYMMSTIAHIGWLLGSLELIGSPGTFIQNVGRGLRDLVTLPYQGLTRSPTWFLLGIGQGTMSFMQHLSSGALGSVTSMASSISHNMERLSLDPHHISYQAQQRQERPATHFTMGIVSGASSFGLSLMSAVAGIVEQPMQSYHKIEGPASPTVAVRSILKGVGKGLLGAVTKPVGGVMELVSQTGQGLMHGTGLARRLRHKKVELQSFTGDLVRADLQCSSTACAVKLGGTTSLLLSTPVKYITTAGTNPALLLISCDKIYLLDCTSNTFQQTFSISEFSLQERDSGAGNLEEVEIEIVANNSSQTPEFPPHLQNVEYFLQQSCDKTINTVESTSPLVEQLHLQMPASPTLSWELESPTVIGNQCQDDRVRVKLLISTHRAVQLLSFYKSLTQQVSLHSPTAFCVHRNLKSESFLSAQSN